VITAYGVADADLHIALPAAFVLRTDQTIAWRSIGESMRDLPLVEVLLQAVREAGGGAARRPEPRDNAGFFILPYLQNVTERGATVMWWTADTQSSCQVELGQEFARHVDELIEEVPSVGKTLHRGVIDGLQPGTTATYRVRCGDEVSPEYTFRTTMPRSQPFHFTVMGDGRTDDDAVIARHRTITGVMLAHRPHLAFQLGDMVQSGNQYHWTRFWRRVVTASDPDDPGIPFASTVPYYLAIGNHEIFEDSPEHHQGYGRGNLETTMARYRALIDVPPNGSSTPDWNERYYAVHYGVATFLVLDTNNTSDDQLDNHDYLDDGSTPDWEPGSEQYRWMVAQLQEAQRSSVFTFVMMHPAPYTRGGHGDREEHQSGQHLRALDPLFRQMGVDAVIASHDHLVEHCLTGPEGFEAAMDVASPQNLNYLVNGNGGQATRPPARGWESWMSIGGDGSPPFHTIYFYDWIGTDHTSFLEVDIEPLEGDRWRASFRTIRDDSQVFDSFAIERQDPLSPPEAVATPS
jgi:hypothetical protein